MSQISLVGKITTKNLANAKKGAALDEVGQRYYIGRIHGDCSGIGLKQDQKGDVFEFLAGSFEAINADTGDITRSGVLYLPSGIHQTLSSQFSNAEADKGKVITFAFDIYSVRSTNAAGYSYAADPVVTAEVVDPLAEARAALPAMPAKGTAPAAAQIEAPAAAPAPAQIEAPKAEAPKAEAPKNGKKT